ESGEWDNVKKEYTLRFTPAGESIYIAHIPPYTNSKLRKLLTDMGRRPAVNIEVIGKTVANRDLHLITVTNPEVGDEQKRLAWLIARQHAWEAGTSWNMEGAVRFISSDDAKAKALRDRVIFKFVPMMDP